MAEKTVETVDTKVQIFTRISPELNEGLERVAEQLETSKADVIRMSIQQFVAGYEYVTPWYLEEG